MSCPAGDLQPGATATAFIVYRVPAGYNVILTMAALGEADNAPAVVEYLELVRSDPGAGCPAGLVLANQTLSGTQILEATSTATLGPNLTVNGSDIVVNAPIVTILGDTEISGAFSLGNYPSCPE